MNINNISKVLGWAETPDTTEGLFLQPEEVASVENTIGDALANAATLTQAQADVEGLKAKNATQAATIATQTETIATLQAEVAKMGKESSGTGSTVAVPAAAEVKEEKAEGGMPRFDSPEHPANMYADGIKKYDSGIPAKK
jgi:hypothetical protein